MRFAFSDIKIMALDSTKWIVASILTSAACCLYAFVIESISEFAIDCSYLLLAMPVGAAVITTIRRRCGFKGVKAYVDVVATWVSHFCGASVGKEAVGIELGKDLSRRVLKRMGMRSGRKSDMLGCLAAFSSLFSTPISGIAFCIEEREFKPRLHDIPMIVVTAACAFAFSRLVGMRPLRFALAADDRMSFRFFILVFASAAFAGVVSLGYVKLRKLIASRSEKFDSEDVILLSIAALALSFVSFNVIGNRYVNGLSVSFFSYQTLGLEAGILLFSILAKVVLTALCVSAGFAGGEFVPFLVIGFLSGAFVARLAGMNSIAMPVFGAFASLACGKKIPYTSFMLLVESLLANFL